MNPRQLAEARAARNVTSSASGYGSAGSRVAGMVSAGVVIPPPINEGDQLDGVGESRALRRYVVVVIYTTLLLAFESRCVIVVMSM